MLSDRDYIRQSLELNLFFMRITKEHSIFMEAAFPAKNYYPANEAEGFKNPFTILLRKTIALSDGIISPEVSKSGEIVTDLTFQAERGTEFYSGIMIDSSLTRMELSIAGMNRDDSHKSTPTLMEQVFMLNQQAIAAATALAGFKSRVLKDVLSCRIITFNYPLLSDHILREDRFYIKMLTKLHNLNRIDTVEEIIEQEVFWNWIMAEHAYFIRGFLDPTEVELFNIANNFGHEFDTLTSQAISLTEQTTVLPDVTEKTLEATTRIRDFKRQGTEGLIACKIKSIAMPLLGDHVVREANHYIRLLKTWGTEI